MARRDHGDIEGHPVLSGSPRPNGWYRAPTVTIDATMASGSMSNTIG
jgi:hypothetical protein